MLIEFLKSAWGFRETCEEQIEAHQGMEQFYSLEQENDFNARGAIFIEIIKGKLVLIDMKCIQWFAVHCFLAVKYDVRPDASI